MFQTLRRVVLGSYFFIVFWLFTFGCFIFLVAGHLLVTLSRSKYRSFFEHEVANFWGKSFFYLIPGWNFKISGREHLPPQGKAVVIVANHQSATDIFALFTLGIQFRWLSKREVFYMPFVGQAMRWAGYVPVVRGDGESQARAITASAEWLKKGVSMVFFPEGTRSESGELGKFKSGAFRLAESADVDILPMVLRGTRGLLVKKSMVPNKATIEIRLLKPVRRQEGEGLHEFMARVREDISASLKGQPL